MNIKEIKSSVEFNLDLMLQRGYELGRGALLSELEEMSTREWNLGNKVTADIIDKILKEVSYEQVD